MIIIVVVVVFIIVIIIRSSRFVQSWSLLHETKNAFAMEMQLIFQKKSTTKRRRFLWFVSFIEFLPRLAANRRLSAIIPPQSVGCTSALQFHKEIRSTVNIFVAIGHRSIPRRCSIRLLALSWNGAFVPPLSLLTHRGRHTSLNRHDVYLQNRWPYIAISWRMTTVVNRQTWRSRPNSQWTLIMSRRKYSLLLIRKSLLRHERTAYHSSLRHSQGLFCQP